MGATEAAAAPLPPTIGRRLWMIGVVSVTLTIIGAVVAASARTQVDVGVYVMGARHLFRGDLYQVRYHDPTLLFTYPPFGAFVYEPLRALPTTLGQVAAALVNVAALLVLLAVSLHAVRPAWAISRVVCWSLIVSLPSALLDPLRITFTFGQINLIIVALVLFDLTTERSDVLRWLPRGVLTGVAAAIKLTPLIFVPYLIMIRRWRAALWALGTFVFFGLALAALAPHESQQYWTKLVFNARRTGGVAYVSNQSLWAASLRATHGHVSVAVIDVVSIVVVVAGLFLARWAHRASSPLLGLLVCATTGLLVSPVTWAHHMVWVIPVIAWLALARDRPVHGRLWAGVVAIFFWCSPIWYVPNANGREYHWRWWEVPLGDAYLIAMVVFLGGVTLHLALNRRGQVADGGSSALRPALERVGD